jgi:uncharacterized integral membrane protein (TIGR00698 family)
MKKEFFPGILMAAAIAGLGYVIQRITGLFGPEMWALVIGMLLASFFAKSTEFLPGFAFSEKKILGWAIALMGLQLSIAPILELGPILIPVILIMMLLSIYFGLKLAPRFGLNPKAGLLVGVGNAICGASAIAAAGPIIGGKARHTAISVSTVYFLGTVGMLILPLMLAPLEWSLSDKGIVAGGTLQAVGQAVAAGAVMGEESKTMATLIKLLRVSLLGPILLLLGWAMRNAGGQTKKVSFALPGFVWAFAAFAILSQLVDLPEQLTSTTKILEKFFLAMAMGAIGAGIKIKELWKQAPGALKLGLLISLFQLAWIISFILLKNQFFGQQP